MKLRWLVGDVLWAIGLLAHRLGCHDLGAYICTAGYDIAVPIGERY